MIIFPHTPLYTLLFVAVTIYTVSWQMQGEEYYEQDSFNYLQDWSEL
jgi:hypothetical protein